MTYGVKWFSEFDDIQENRVYRIEIQERDYADAPTEVQSGDNPVQIQQVDVNDPFQVIRPQKITINWVANPLIGDFNINELFITDDRKYRIRFYEEVEGFWRIRWYGWVIPIDCEEPYHSKPYPVTISGSCGLPFLTDDYYLTPTGEFIEGKKNLASILADCLQTTGYALPFESCVHLYADGMDTNISPLRQAEIDVDGLRGMKCREIVEGILAPFGAFITQSEGEWSIVEVESQNGMQVRFDKFDAAGDSLGAQARYIVSSFGRDYYSGADIPLISPTSEITETRAQPTSIVTETVSPGIPQNRLFNGTFSGVVTGGNIPGWNNRTSGLVPWSRAGTGRPEDPYRLEYYKHISFDPKKKKYAFRPFAYFDTGPITLNLGDFNIPEEKRLETKLKIMGAIRMHNALGFSMAVTINEAERKRASFLNEDTEWFYSEKEDATVDIRGIQTKYDPVSKTYFDLKTQEIDIESKRITNYLKVNGEAVVQIRVRIFPGVQGPGYNGADVFTSIEDLSLTIVEGSVFEGEHAYQVDGGLDIRDANENEFTTIIADKIDITTPENSRAVNRVMTGYMTLAGGSTLTTGWRKSYDGSPEPIQKRALRTRIRQMCGERARIQGTFMGYDFRPNQSVFVDLETVADPDKFYTVLGWTWDVKEGQFDATLHELDFTPLVDEDVYLYDDKYGARGNRMYRGVGSSSSGSGSKGEYEEIVVDPIPVQFFTVGVYSERVIVLADYIVSSHKTYNLTGRVISYPDWVSFAITDSGPDQLQINVVIGASPKTVETGFVLVELTGEYIEEDYTLAIPVRVVKPTKIVYTLYDGVGAVIGNIVNGSAYPLPEAGWKLLAGVHGFHDGYFAKVSGPGFYSEVTPYPYLAVEGTETDFYSLPKAGLYLSEAGTNSLDFATFRNDGEELYTQVKRDNIRFTLYDEEYLGKMRFELWVGGSKLGDIAQDGSSAFNTEGQPFQIKAIVVGQEHDEIILTLSGPADYTHTYLQDPAVEDATYDLYTPEASTAQPEGSYDLDALLRLKDEFDVSQDVYSRFIAFKINKKKVAATGGNLQLVAMRPNQTSYDVMGTLSLAGNLFTLPAGGWNVLLDGEVPANTRRSHVLLQKKGTSLVAISTELYTGDPQFKQYGEEATEDSYLIFGTLSSKDIDKIHLDETSFRVVITDEDTTTGEVIAVQSGDFSFGVLEDLDDLEISEPGNSGDGIQEYLAGNALDYEDENYIRTFNVRVDNESIEIYDPTEPTHNWLRIKDKGVVFTKIQDIPTLTVIGKLTAGTGVPYAVTVLNGASAVAASDTSLPTTLWVKNQLGTTVGTGLVNRLAKYLTTTTITYSLIEESGINLTAREGQYVVDILTNTNVRGLVLQTGGANRWTVGKAGLETGSNAGSDWTMQRWGDTPGTLLGTPVVISRATGIMTLANQLTLTVTGVAPMIVSSTVLVTNLNADLLDGQHGAFYQARANHTGTQLASTISDFSPAVLATTLTGLSVVTGSPVVATDTILQAIGKLQGQTNTNTASVAGTIGRIAYFNTATSIANSIASQSGINFTVDGQFISNVAANANMRGFGFQVGGANRILAGKIDLESGSNSGSNFAIQMFDDAGTTLLSTPFKIIRATGATTFSTQVTIQGAVNPPLVVSSTALVTNFNADLLDGQHGAYYRDWDNLTNKKSVIAGVGLSGGGVLSADVTVSMGTPSTLTNATTNSASGTTHTHAITTGSLIAGSNITFTSGSGTNRLVGSGDLTISASSMPWTLITSKPTDLAGFGILDGASISYVDTGLLGKENTFAKGNLVQGSGVTLTGTLTNRLVGSGDVTIAVSLPSNIVTGTGTTARMAYWNSGSTIAASGCMYQIGASQVTVDATFIVEGTFLPPIVGALPASGEEGEIIYSDTGKRWYGWNGTTWKPLSDV